MPFWRKLKRTQGGQSTKAMPDAIAALAKELRVKPRVVIAALQKLGSRQDVIGPATADEVRASILGIVRCPQCSVEVQTTGGYALEWFRLHVAAAYIACSDCGKQIPHHEFAQHIRLRCPIGGLRASGDDQGISVSECLRAEKPIQVPRPQAAVPQPQVASDLLAAPGPAQRYAPAIPVERLHFRLLPPGTWSMQDVIDHYRRQSSRLPADSYDASRLWQIEMLGPPKCYVGDETWSGYVLFDFENSTSLLEKPFYGNATYVLAGDWRKMVRKTKAGGFPGFVLR